MKIVNFPTKHAIEPNYLFFGSKTHLLSALFNDKKRAFYHAASQMTIGCLPEKDTIAYLREKFAGSAITRSGETAKYIISVTSDIPHYIQLLALTLGGKNIFIEYCFTHHVPEFL
ncbi:MAG: hypothetical protein LBU22_11330 [Dysgonamonadaceae bacterium]|jgi:hypothetical protein|nr:hypothetical protein [Dysgonamonadaceae bacterium]